MKKRYIIPEMETAPLQLNACIMSGGSSDPTLDYNSDVQNGHFEAPHRRVY